MYYYVYQYSDPNTNLPFYIGKGTGKRFLSHINTARRNLSRPTACSNRCKQLLESSNEPIITLLWENVTEDLAHKLETNLIAQYGRLGIDVDGILVNKSKGGRSNSGYHHTAESKMKISKAKKGHSNHSEETRKIISEKTSEALLNNPEALKKISETHLGKSKSKNHKKKLINHLRNISAESKERGRIKRIGQTRTLAQTENISQATKKAMLNTKVINKMKASSKKRWSNQEERTKIAIKNSRTFQLTHKETGQILIVKNLAAYCRENSTHYRKVHLEFNVDPL